MHYTIETVYDQRAMTAMVYGLRKTIRKKRSRRSHFFGWFAVMLGLVLVLSASQINWKTLLTMAAVVVMSATLIWEDSINAYLARRRGLPGLERSQTTFYASQYHAVTAIGESKFHYDHIRYMAEVGHYLVFVLGPSHGQVYDMRTLSGGTKESFYSFLMEHTGMQPKVL